MSTAKEPEFVSLGVVIRPHGVRGALLVKPISRLIQSLGTSSEIFLGTEHVPAVVLGIKSHRKDFLLRIEGCEDRNAAEQWRGSLIALRFDHAEPLEEDEYYYWQILDLEVFTEGGERLGWVRDILETGANDVYVVKDERDRQLLLPAVEEVIRSVDLRAGRLIVALMPGMDFD